MSPSVGNFVHDLVEMAKAMEELPQVRRDLQHAQDLVDQQGHVIASREETILKLKQEIEALNEKVRQSEVARDSAETMFLETDDKLAAFRRLVEAFGKDTQSLIAAQEPPKPEPIKPEQDLNAHAVTGEIDYHDLSQGGDGKVYGGPQRDESAAPPTSAPPAPTGTGTENVALSSEQGQSAADPTSANTMGGQDTVPANTASQGAVSTQTEPAHSEPVRLQPYAGKRYSEHPTYVNYQDWIAGGGIDYDYYR